METIIKTIMVGIGATITMDVWALMLKTFTGIKSLNYKLLGRWLGHLKSGQFFHKSIANARPVKHELIIGWAVHYLIGISFAVLLVSIYGGDWLQKPTIFPPLFIGLITVVAPFFIMQPAMGAGVASSNLPKPNLARIKSLVTHIIYGLGLYLSAILLTYLKWADGMR